MADSSQRSRRVPISLKINLKLVDRNAFVERFAQNISRTGIFIRAKEPLAVGSRVNFEYRLANDQRLIRGAGIVRWARSEAEANERQPPGMGIEFTDVDPTTDALISEIVLKHGEGERAPKREAKRVSEDAPGPTLDLSEENLLDGMSALMPPLESAAKSALPVTPPPRVETPAPAAPVTPTVALPPPEAPKPAPVLPPTPAPAPEIVEAPAEAPAAPVVSKTESPAFADSLAPPSIEVPAAAASVTPAPKAHTAGVVQVDLASDVLRWSSDPDAEVSEQPWHLGAEGTALGNDGAPVPAPLRLFDLGRAACTILLRHAGLGFLGHDAKGPRLDIGGREVHGHELVQAALQRLAVAGPAVLRVVVPTGAGPKALAALEAAASAAGLPAPETKESAELLLAACAPPLAQPALVIELGAAGVSVAVVNGEIRARGFAVDAGWRDVDHALLQGARYQLAKVHGIDVDDDPELATTLRAQVSDAKHRPAAAPLHLAIAGATLDLAPESVAEILEHQTDRLLLLGERLLTQCGINPNDTQSLLLYTEAPPWPGLEAALRDWAPHLEIMVQSKGDARLRAWGVGE